MISQRAILCSIFVCLYAVATAASACRIDDLKSCETVAPPTLELRMPDQNDAGPEISGVMQAPLVVSLTRQFIDDFDTFTPNAGTWRHYYNHGDYPDFHSRTLQANQEQQLYVDPDFAGTASGPLGLNPFSVANGVLRIEGQAVPDDLVSSLEGFAYMSGMLSSEQSFEQTYGYFEARMKPPVGQGLWSAFWLKTHHAHTPRGRPAWPPEIDVMEYLGSRPDRYYTTVHWDIMPDNKKSGAAVINVSPGSDFNTYGVLWTATQTVFYFNRQPVQVIETKSNHHVPMFMVVNLALGGKWPGPVDAANLPALLQIDWIAAYHIAPNQ